MKDIFRKSRRIQRWEFCLLMFTYHLLNSIIYYFVYNTLLRNMITAVATYFAFDIINFIISFFKWLWYSIDDFLEDYFD